MYTVQQWHLPASRRAPTNVGNSMTRPRFARVRPPCTYYLGEMTCSLAGNWTIRTRILICPRRSHTRFARSETPKLIDALEAIIARLVSDVETRTRFRFK